MKIHGRYGNTVVGGNPARVLKYLESGPEVGKKRLDEKTPSVLRAVSLLTLLAACGTANNMPASAPMPTAAPAEESTTKETEFTETVPLSSTLPAFTVMKPVLDGYPLCD